MRGVDVRRARELAAEWARAHGVRGDARPAAVLDAVFARLDREGAVYSDVFEPSWSRDAAGFHLYRFSYALPWFRRDRASAASAVVAMAAPFGDDAAALARTLLRASAAPCVAQVLFGLAYDAPDRWRVKVYLQFDDAAGPDALRVAEVATGSRRLRASHAGRALHLLGVDIGPRGIAGAKLYFTRARVALDAERGTELYAALAARGVAALPRALAIHRLRAPDDPAALAPAEVDFALADTGLAWDAVRALPPVRALLGDDAPPDALARAFRLRVRRVSAPVGPLARLTAYYALDE